MICMICNNNIQNFYSRASLAWMLPMYRFTASQSPSLRSSSFCFARAYKLLAFFNISLYFSYFESLPLSIISFQDYSLRFTFTCPRQFQYLGFDLDWGSKSKDWFYSFISLSLVYLLSYFYLSLRTFSFSISSFVCNYSYYYCFSYFTGNGGFL